MSTARSTTAGRNIRRFKRRSLRGQTQTRDRARLRLAFAALSGANCGGTLCHLAVLEQASIRPARRRSLRGPRVMNHHQRVVVTFAALGGVHHGMKNAIVRRARQWLRSPSSAALIAGTASPSSTVMPRWLIRRLSGAHYGWLNVFSLPRTVSLEFAAFAALISDMLRLATD